MKLRVGSGPDSQNGIKKERIVMKKILFIALAAIATLGSNPTLLAASNSDNIIDTWLKYRNNYAGLTGQRGAIDFWLLRETDEEILGIPGGIFEDTDNPDGKITKSALLEDISPEYIAKKLKEKGLTNLESIYNLYDNNHARGSNLSDKDHLELMNKYNREGIKERAQEFYANFDKGRQSLKNKLIDIVKKKRDIFDFDAITVPANYPKQLLRKHN